MLVFRAESRLLGKRIGVGSQRRDELGFGIESMALRRGKGSSSFTQRRAASVRQLASFYDT
jgi:hypothetical protein